MNLIDKAKSRYGIWGRIPHFCINQRVQTCIFLDDMEENWEELDETGREYIKMVHSWLIKTEGIDGGRPYIFYGNGQLVKNIGKEEALASSNFWLAGKLYRNRAGWVQEELGDILC